MILWGLIVGALLGWIAADFDQFGLILGAMAGAAAGWGLRKAVRNEIASMLEQQADAKPVATGVPPLAPSPSSPRVVKVVRDDMPVAPREPVRPAPATQPAPAAVAAPAEPGIAERGLVAAREWLLGGNTIVRVGLVVLFIGLAFLARWAAGAGLLPIEIRLAMIAVAGIALLVVGFNRRAVKPAFALALQGGGVAILYLTIFAAVRYDILPPSAAFALMVLVCIGGCALALLQDAEPMAAASFVGGYAVPVLLSTGGGPVAAMFAYHSLLNLGVLALAWKRPWRSINLIGFLATFGIASSWGVMRYQESDFAVAQAHLILSVAIYLAAALLYARNRAGPAGRMVDSSLLFGVALAGFGLEVGLVGGFAYGSAFAALAFGAVYLVIATAVMRRGGADYRLLAEAMLAIGVGFATLAIPLALGAQWTGAAWALEGAGAFWVGMRQARWMSRAFGIALQLVAALLFLAMLENPVSALPILNPIFITGLLVAFPAFATAWWLRNPLPHSESRWARGYAAIEAGLARPAFLLGFAIWCLALVSEIVRMLPPAQAGAAPIPVFRLAIQQQLVMLALVASAWGWSLIGRRTGWTVATWPGRATLPVLFVTWLMQATAGEHVLYHPGWAIWLGALCLHLHLLWLNDVRGNAAPRSGEALLYRATHVGGVWLGLVLLADCLWLAIDRAQLWNSSWAGVVFLLSAVAVLSFLCWWAGKAASSWPLDRYRTAYLWTAAVPVALLVFGGALITALVAEGDARPLPFVPLLNPVELVVALAIGALILWRRAVLALDPVPRRAGWLGSRGTLLALAGLAFVAVNMMWLRIAHHFLDVAWDSDALLGDYVVQTGLAILWTLLALGLMTFAHRRARRPVWLAGAALLVLVVLKLFFVDLSNAGGGARIVTFIVVGVLMLVVGYFAPLPPRRKETEEVRP